MKVSPALEVQSNNSIDDSMVSMDSSKNVLVKTTERNSPKELKKSISKKGKVKKSSFSKSRAQKKEIFKEPGPEAKINDKNNQVIHDEL